MSLTNAVIEKQGEQGEMLLKNSKEDETTVKSKVVPGLGVAVVAVRHQCEINFYLFYPRQSEYAQRYPTDTSINKQNNLVMHFIKTL